MSRIPTLGSFLLMVLFASAGSSGAGEARPQDAPFWTGRDDAASFAALQDAHIARSRAQIEGLRKRRGRRTIENTLAPFDRALFELETAAGQSGLMQNVHPDEDFRVAAEKASQRITVYWTELMLDRRVYDALAAVPVANADPATRHYLEVTLRAFRLMGVDKDAATRRRLKELNEELVQIGQEFTRNIRNDRRFIVVRHEGELAGLPADYIARHKPDANGLITLSTDATDVMPVLDYARSDSLRRAMHMDYSNRGYPTNVPVLDRMLARRHELASLLGFASWADLVTADKMVASAREVSAFIDRVVEASAAQAGAEYEALLAAKRREQPKADRIEAWEQRYWAEQERQSRYAVDSQSVRPYLSFTRVKQGVLDVSSRLFGVTFRRVPDAPVWHPSVECWEVYEGPVKLGRFYLDLFPRPKKFNHAAHFSLRAGVGGAHVAEAALVCNFPGSVPGDPGLMEQKEVVTFFHEFGHLMHHIFAGRQRWAGIAGINTERDFVEAPSQMLEEWTWEPRVLSTFARHHETGQPIPAALVARMRRAIEFPRGLNVRRQMVLARTSLAYHDRPPDRLDTDALYREIGERYLPFPAVDGTHFQYGFSHLEGYSAMYYTYMWSSVIAKDLHAQFDPNDPFDPEQARRYRDVILAAGASAPAAELVERFLGRPFRYDPWEKWLNAHDDLPATAE